MRLLMVAHTNRETTWTPYFARYFQQKGWTVKVAGVTPDRIPDVETEFIGIEPFRKDGNKHIFVSCVPRLRRLIRRFQPDIVFAIYLASNGLSAALSWNGPLAVAAVGGDVLNHDRRKGASLLLRKAIIRYVCTRAQLINTVSRDLTRELRNHGVREEKILELPFGTDVSTFSPDPEMPRGKAKRFICTRKHETIYDIPLILRALGRLKASGKQFHCTFTSTGSQLEHHKAMALEEKLDGFVSFTGNIPHDELPRLLRTADVYISASHGDGTSVSLLEGMATGMLPVVSRIQANTPWVKDGQNGLLFRCQDSVALAHALERAMEDAELRRRALQLNPSIVRNKGDMKQNMEMLFRHLEALARGERL